MRRMAALLAAAMFILVAGCSVGTVDWPELYPLATYSYKELGQGDSKERFPVPFEVVDKVDQILYDYFGTPQEPFTTDMSVEKADSVFRGSRLYHTHCIHCHGMNGGGNGPTGPFLYPKPRDYRRGVFKWKSTYRSAKPTRDDLARVIREGAMGSSMPAFNLLSNREVNDLIDYVIFLSKRGELERSMLVFYAAEAPPVTDENTQPDKEALQEIIQELPDYAQEEYQRITGDWASAAEQILEPEVSMPQYAYNSEEYEASLQRGKKLYLGDGACAKCHNLDGRADPNKLAEAERKVMVDDWGNPLYPRNLNLGIYRGGRRPVDLFRRVHEGITGTGMPAASQDKVKPQDMWDLVNFIRALPYRKDLLAEFREAAHAGHSHEVEAETGTAAGGHGG